MISALPPERTPMTESWQSRKTTKQHKTLNFTQNSSALMSVRPGLTMHSQADYTLVSRGGDWGEGSG